jgi:spermidine synthase
VIRQHHWPYALFVLSGAAALVLEAVLLRELAWVVGSSAAATALVLAAFMGGLALGSLAFGRLADRSRRPLRLFGMLEIGAALFGAGLAWLLGSGRDVFVGVLRAIPEGPLRPAVELLLAFGLVLVPTFLMGGTLPALSRFLIRDLSRFVGSLGLLYGMNTLGAAAGVFVAGFFLFERFGVAASAYLAAAVQVGVGLVAFGLDRVAGPSTPAAASNSHPAARRGEGNSHVWLAAAAAGGFVMLGYEVLWTRLLSLLMRSFSYSFSLMLSLFLLGLFLGAALLALVGRRVERPGLWVGWLQLAMGVYVAFSILWLPGILAPVSAESFGQFLWRSSLRAALVVLPPTMLSGAVLPLLARGFSRSTASVGGDVGTVYAINTAGGIAGALIAGLLLLPGLGAPDALVVLAVANAATGALVLFALSRQRVHSVVGLALVAACLLPLATSSDRFIDAFLRATRSFNKIGELLFFHEGAADTVAIVTKEYGFHDPEAKSLITNGVAMSATVKPVWRYMALEGHLPLLLGRSTERVLAVGVGTGITLGALASHPEVESIDAVELSAGVMRGLEWFRTENGAAFENPRVHMIRDDGRHFLELSRDGYDVITLEPPPPIVAGSVHLYSLDFYSLCRKRLREGGVVAQWLPLHAQSLASARMTARTFVAAFPHAMLWLPSVRDAVLIGGDAPLGLDVAQLRRMYEVPETRLNLERAYLETPEAFLATYLLDRAGIEAWAGDAPIITDEHPWMEFFRNQGGNMNDGDIASLLEPPQAAWSWVRGLNEEPGTLRAVETENRALRSYVASVVSGDNRLGAQAAQLTRGTEFFLYRFGCATEQVSRLQSGAAPSDQVRGHLAMCSRLRGRP